MGGILQFSVILAVDTDEMIRGAVFESESEEVAMDRVGDSFSGGTTIVSGGGKCSFKASPFFCGMTWMDLPGAMFIFSLS